MHDLYPIKKLYISESSRKTLAGCARKVEFAKFYAHRKPQDNSFAADVGHALHEGYQNYLVNRNVEQAVYTMMMAYPVEDYYSKRVNNTRSLEACYATLMALIHAPETEDYELVDVRCLDGELRPAVEVEFEIHFPDFSLDGLFTDGKPNLPVIYRGFIDIIALRRSKGKIATIDLKTHRLTANDMEAKYKFDEQILPYDLVIEHILGERLDRLDVTYLSTYIDLENPIVTDYSFTKDRDLIQDWALSLYEDLERLARYYQTGWFPRAKNSDTCFAYQSKCRYFDECDTRDHDVLKRVFTPKGDGKILPDGRGEPNPWIKIDLSFGRQG